MVNMNLVNLDSYHCSALLIRMAAIAMALMRMKMVTKHTNFYVQKLGENVIVCESRDKPMVLFNCLKI